MRFLKYVVLALILVGFAHGVPSVVAAGANNGVQLNLSLGGDGLGDQSSTAVQLLILLTVLSLAPSIVVMMTSFSRIVIVLSFVRTALGIQQPSNQIVVGLSLFLTLFVMYPVWNQIEQEALLPLREKKIEIGVAMERAGAPLKKFMVQHTREKDLKLFASMAPPTAQAGQAPKSVADLGMNIVVPAFMVSELRTAFQMGFVLFLPFLIIDLVVSSILMSLGMMMLPPMMVTLPLKLLVFVLADGWDLIVRSLVLSFQN